MRIVSDMTFPHSRPAPAFDLFNVYFERIYDPTMHIVFAFDGHLNETFLQTATMHMLRANPYLRSRFAEGNGMPCWEEIPEAEWERAFVHLSPGDADTISMPPKYPPAPLNVRKGPQMRVTLTRQEKEDQITVTCHHGFADAGGLRDLARSLFATYQELLKNPDFQPTPTGWYDRSTAPYLALFTDEDMRVAQKKEGPFVDRWRFPAEQRGRGTPRIASRTFSPERLQQAKAFGREHDATINDIMIAAFFLAFQKIRNDPADIGAPRAILTSADLRRPLVQSGDADGSAGTSTYATDATGEYQPMNLSISYEVTLTVGDKANLDDIIGQVTTITKQRKAEGLALGLGCALFYEEICATGMPAIQQFFDGMIQRYETNGQKNPVFSNIGILREEDFLPLTGINGRPLILEDVCILPCVCWPFGFLMALSTFRDSMTIITAYEEGPYSQKKIEEFLALVDWYLP